MHPPDTVDLKEKQDAIKKLLNRGATINELNAFRKHLSLVKGGFLATAARPATVITIILSDVIGDLLSVIASGPTSPDPSTFLDAIEILKKYDLINDVSTSIIEYLQKGLKGLVPETPKPGDRVFEKVNQLIVASNRMSVKAVEQRAKTLSYDVKKIDKPVQGSAKKAGYAFAERLNQILQMKTRNLPICVVAGGETTVQIKGNGIGGRNQEMVLAFMDKALELGLNTEIPYLFMSLGTDGVDGPTDAAGACITNTFIRQLSDHKETVSEFLNDNDSYHFFKKHGGLIQSGRTGTNVMDVQILLAG
jgi:glycerate-2-kinase